MRKFQRFTHSNQIQSTFENAHHHPNHGSALHNRFKRQDTRQLAASNIPQFGRRRVVRQLFLRIMHSISCTILHVGWIFRHRQRRTNFMDGIPFDVHNYPVRYLRSSVGKRRVILTRSRYNPFCQGLTHILPRTLGEGEHICIQHALIFHMCART